MRQLQDQVSVLSENQAANDERYSRVKADNVTLTAKIHVLEENIREIEMRGEERLVEEQRRNRDIVQRLEREKQLEIENYTIRLQVQRNCVGHSVIKHSSYILLSHFTLWCCISDIIKVYKVSYNVFKMLDALHRLELELKVHCVKVIQIKNYKANVKVLKAILLEILHVIAELIMFRYIE